MNRKQLLKEYFRLLLLEGDKRDIIINKIGLPQEVADWAYNLSKKHHLWIANSFLNYLKEHDAELNPHGGNLNWELLDKKSPTERANQINFLFKLPDIMEKLTPLYQSLFQNLNQASGKGIDLKQFKTPEEAQIQLFGKMPDLDVEEGSGEIVKEYGDGYYWIDLHKSSCSREAQRMGHCGTAGGRSSTLISLRDKFTKPHITIEYNKAEESINQIKGKQNEKPAEKYMSYLVDLLSDFPYKLTEISTDDIDYEDIKKYDRENSLENLFGSEVSRALNRLRRGDSDYYDEDINLVAEEGDDRELRQLIGLFDSYYELLRYASGKAHERILEQMSDYDKIYVLEQDIKENGKYDIPYLAINMISSIDPDNWEGKEEIIDTIMSSKHAELREEAAKYIPYELLEPYIEDEKDQDVLNAVVSKIDDKNLLWSYVRNQTSKQAKLLAKAAFARLLDLGYKGPMPDQLNLPNLADSKSI